MGVINNELSRRKRTVVKALGNLRFHSNVSEKSELSIAKVLLREGKISFGELCRWVEKDWFQEAIDWYCQGFKKADGSSLLKQLTVNKDREKRCFEQFCKEHVSIEEDNYTLIGNILKQYHEYGSDERLVLNEVRVECLPGVELEGKYEEVKRASDKYCRNHYVLGCSACPNDVGLDVFKGMTLQGFDDFEPVPPRTEG